MQSTPRGRFHLVSLYADLNQKPGWAPNTQIKMSNKTIKELKAFLYTPPTTAEGRSWYPPEHTTTIWYVTLITDASKYGWGATFTKNQKF